MTIPPTYVPMPAGTTRGQVQAMLDAAYDPLATLDLVEEFAGGIAANGQLGVLGWQYGGGSTPVGVAGEADHVGIYRLDTSATAGTTAYALVRCGVVNALFRGSAAFDVVWVFRLNTNDANTRMRIGLTSNAAIDTPSDAAYLEKLDADGQWFGVVRANAVQARTPALAACDTGWHRLRVRRIDAGTAGFALDGGPEAALATPAFAAGLHPGAHVANSAAASKTLDLDFMRLRIGGLAR